ncbi:MAG: cytochrome c peroxidase [Bacteroidota bacterium]
MKHRLLVTLVLLLAYVFACQTEIKEQSAAADYAVELPADVIAMQIPEDNPLTEVGIELGRRLFYDPILSLDSTQACVNCHQPHLAFTDGQTLSLGVKGLPGSRNAMSLVNVGLYYDGLFWDGRVATLEEQSLHPITDERELAANWPLILDRLKSHPDYSKRFRMAFDLKDIEAIDSMHIARSLAQFERTLVSFNSKFDQVQKGLAEFTLSEQRGWTIFFDASPDLPHAECNHCHVDPLFTTLAFENNGVELVRGLEAYQDKGRGVVTGNVYDNGKFRVPTLRNITLTAPYMHDGRFQTLEKVIDHYDSGGHFSENVSPNVRELNLSAADKADLLAFLYTLTDTTLVHNLAFSNPFEL